MGCIARSHACALGWAGCLGCFLEKLGWAPRLHIGLGTSAAQLGWGISAPPLGWTPRLLSQKRELRCALRLLTWLSTCARLSRQQPSPTDLGCIGLGLKCTVTRVRIHSCTVRLLSGLYGLHACSHGCALSCTMRLGTTVVHVVVHVSRQCVCCLGCMGWAGLGAVRRSWMECLTQTSDGWLVPIDIRLNISYNHLVSSNLAKQVLSFTRSN